MKSLKNLTIRPENGTGRLQGVSEVAGHEVVIGELGLPDNLNIRRQ